MLCRLFKKTSTNAIQFWEIAVSDEEDATYLVTTYGQLDTPNPQTTRDPIRQGKNAGRANATTRYEQAVAEAEAKHLKQRKKGYVDSIEGARSGEVDAAVLGGVLPMLAHKFADHAEKIITPCWIQAKYDGVRAIAIIKDGSATLWSRERNQFFSVPHIVEALELTFHGQTLILDGELYNHELKEDFEQITSLIRQETPDPRADIVQYHIYDIVSDAEYSDRWAQLQEMAVFRFNNPLVLVPSVLVEEVEILEYFQQFRNLGYEGAMVRNAAGRYVHKRSYDLQKIKSFEDGEFDVIGIKEGRGRLVGHVGAFMCRTPAGVEFEVKLKGNTERLREHYQNHALWQGKKMTVKHQGYTKKGSLRFPTGVAIRDYE